jgi:DNA-binding response OmpR family regulator
LILLIHPDEAFRRSLESVLSHAGHHVVTAQDVDEMFAEATTHRPDAIILDAGLVQPGHFAGLRALRDNPGVSRATPIILVADGTPRRTDQLAALRAGAWELRGAPFDTEDLVARLEAYVQAKREADRHETEGLVDRASGLYSAAGIARRSEELAAFTARQRLALACAVFQPAAEEEDVNRLAAAFKRVGRTSDAIGRTGRAEFAVFAPATDDPAAKRMVRRFRDAARVSLRAGSSAVSGTQRARPADLLAKARGALKLL